MVAAEKSQHDDSACDADTACIADNAPAASEAPHTSRDAWLGWKTWKSEFELFSTATQLNKQPKEVQAATLLVTIREEARKVYASFKFELGEDTSDVNLIIQKKSA